MKETLKILSWIGLILGVFAIFGAITVDPIDGYALFGGVLFASQGTLALVYIDATEGKQ